MGRLMVVEQRAKVRLPFPIHPLPLSFLDPFSSLHQLHHRHYRRPAVVSVQLFERQTNVSLLSFPLSAQTTQQVRRVGKADHHLLPGGWSPLPTACATHDWTARTRTTLSEQSKAHIVPVNSVTSLFMTTTTSSLWIQITMHAHGLTHELVRSLPERPARSAHNMGSAERDAHLCICSIPRCPGSVCT